MKKQKLYFSRLLSLVLSLALLCTALSVPFSVSAADDTPSGTSATTIWDGDVADVADLSLKDTSNPTNSAENPYIIDSAEKLAYIARAGYKATVNKYYELTCDIYLNDVTSDNWYETDNNRQWFGENVAQEIKFAGNLNGKGHVIHGIYINESTRTDAGLFMLLDSNGSISNLGIEKSYIDASTGNAGALVGRRSWGTLAVITNCYSSDTVTVNGKYAGGLIGSVTYPTTFNNCYSSAVLNATERIGGIAGSVEWAANIATFNNCYNTQSKISMAGGGNDNPTYNNCYNLKGETWDKNPGVNKLTVAQMTGKAAYENMIGYDFNSVWYVFDDITPKLRVFGVIKPEPKIWDGDVATESDLKLKTEGANSAENPYIIDSAEKLAYIARATGGSTVGKYYELTCDIYLNNVTGDEWYTTNSPRQWFNTEDTTTVRFRGKLNGNGHVIYGIYINEEARANAGLFMGTDGGASISNLGIEKSYIKGKTNVGAFAGNTNNYGNLDLINCYSSDTVILSSYDNYTSWQTSIGGLIGVLNAANQNLAPASQLITIENCYSAATGSDTDRMGGLFGNAKVSADKIRIANCYSSQDSMPMIGYTGYIEGGTFENNYSNSAYSSSVSSVLTMEQMLGNGMENLVNATDSEGKLVWYTKPNSTPKLAVFLIDGDVNGDKTVNILDLVRIKKVCIGTVGYNLINFDNTNLDNDDNLYTINSADIIKLRKILLGVDF